MLTTWVPTVVVAALLAAAGCGADAGVAADAAAAGDAGPGDTAAAAADAAPPADGGVVDLVLYHTADEHGWLEPASDGAWVWGGAANVGGWLRQEGFDPARDLLLSGGDNWTGPAISTWFAGAPVVAAMNDLGYAATAIGNHEFDFGQDTLRARVAQARFAVLGANVRDAATGAVADFATEYTLAEVSGVTVGVIGLTTPATAYDTMPKNVAGLDFAPLAQTLVALVPTVRAAGAEVVVVLAHESFGPMLDLADTLPVRVDALFAAHDHINRQVVQGGIPVVASSWAWHGYTVTTLAFDRGARAVVDATTRFVAVRYPDGEPDPVTPDPQTAATVAAARAQADAALGEQLGTTVTGLPLGPALGNWATDAWRWAYPAADVAIQNLGGLRQGLAPGAVTLGDVVSVLPFENSIYQLRLTGAQLVANLATVTAGCPVAASCWPAVSGLTWTGSGGTIAVRVGGAPLDPAATYTVLVHDYIYSASSGWLFASQDPAPIDLGVNYRQPAVDWTRQLGTSAADPLEAHVDPAPRWAE
ncbi:MAG TPA: 5'-nucleotidase C-terminal domain-containing protein [Polyangia bacterium]|jgi:2',3'-cyclic-nucleotide 2'-phosphodiesterase (5'-nucleotidase family)